MSEHLSDYALDQLRIGGAPAEDAAHLEACAECRARNDALNQQAEAFLSQHPVEALADDALGRAPRSGGPRARHWARRAAAAGIAAVATLLLFVAVPDQTRTKGSAALVELFVVENGDPRPARGPVDRSAKLAVRVTPEHPVFVRILWESTPEAVTALYPPQEAPAWSVPESKWLGQKIELDGASAPERMIVVVCARPFPHAKALREARQRDDCEVESLSIEKK